MNISREKCSEEKAFVAFPNRERQYNFDRNLKLTQRLKGFTSLSSVAKITKAVVG